MSSRIPNIHESTITSCQFNMSDDRIITTSIDKTTKFFDLVSHRSTMTLRYYIYIDIDWLTCQSMMQDKKKYCYERLILYNRKEEFINELIN